MPTTKRLVAAGRIEPVYLAERHLQSLQRLADRLDHAAGKRGRRHGVALTDEQRIVEQLAHAAERVADRGLREVEAPAGARDAAFSVDGVEHHEQVQVDFG